MLRHREISRETRMPGGGVWELGLRSDMPGAQTGGSKTQLKEYGEITSVNVWNRVLRRKELKEIMVSCVSKYQGNVRAWKEFKSAAGGNVKLVKSTCCIT